jgi:hypothetical protein
LRTVPRTRPFAGRAQHDRLGPDRDVDLAVGLLAVRHRDGRAAQAHVREAVGAAARMPRTRFASPMKPATNASRGRS